MSEAGAPVLMGSLNISVKVALEGAWATKATGVAFLVARVDVTGGIVWVGKG